MNPSTARVYTEPFQVLCEGNGDSGFVEALGAAYDLPKFEVTCVSEAGGFEDKLRSFEIFIDRGVIRKVLILADADDDPERALVKIRTQIRRVRIYPVPNGPRAIRGSTRASVAIVQLPGDYEIGNLETLFLRAIEAERADLIACARTFAACQLAGGEDGWRKGQRDKMLLRSILAATLEDDPNSSLNYIWGKTGLPMNIRCNEFRWVADFISEFFQ